MHATLKEWNLEKWKAFKLQQTEMQMKICNCWNANEMLQHLKCKWKFAKNLKWNFIWNSLIIAQRESVWLQWKGFALAKTSQGSGGWVSQKELTSCNFPSNVRNYSLSQMPSDVKLIALQFRFRIRAGLVLTKYYLHVLLVWY